MRASSGGQRSRSRTDKIRLIVADDHVTVLEGLRKKLGSAVTIRYAKGVEIDRVQPSIFDEQFASPKPMLKTQQARDAEFQHAVDQIKKSEVAILVLGEAQNMSGEAIRVGASYQLGIRNDVDFPMRLFERLRYRVFFQPFSPGQHLRGLHSQRMPKADFGFRTQPIYRTIV